jgi:hypothetical protein
MAILPKPNARVGIRAIVSSNVAHNGTFQVSYPPGVSAGMFSLSDGDHILLADGAEYRAKEGKIAVTIGASAATVTWKGNRVLEAGTEVVLGLQVMTEPRDHQMIKGLTRHLPVSFLYTVQVHYGPVLAGGTSQVASGQTLPAAGFLAINGSLASGGIARADVPRQVTLTSSGNLSGVTFKIDGKDVRGRKVTAQLAGPNNNTVTTGKTFVEVESIYANAAVGAAVSAGFNNSFGLPFFVPNPEYKIVGLVDGVAEAITVVPGASGEATATSGDPCGRINFTTAPNGSKVFEAILLTPNVEEAGVQYSDAEYTN